MEASKTAREILESVVASGRQELDRASLGLAFSGFAAGLNISFSAVAMAAVGAKTGEIGLLAMAVYPVGFLIVILGRAQLFTENTVTPVTVALTNVRIVPNMLRLWAVVLLSNLLGTLVFAATLAHARILTPEAIELVLERVSHELHYGFWTIVIKGVFGGWLVALIAWLVASSRDTISQILFIWLLALLIPVAGLTHSVAGSTEVMISAFTGAATWAEYLVGFLLPTTLGNIIGGVFLVALLNYGQVIGSRKKTRLSKYLDRRKNPEVDP